MALLLDFPIWTEDQDFFGSSVATWTTDRVELYSARIMNALDKKRDALPSSTLPSSVVTHRCR